jgi:hypothetical protein
MAIVCNASELPIFLSYVSSFSKAEREEIIVHIKNGTCTQFSSRLEVLVSQTFGELQQAHPSYRSRIADEIREIVFWFLDKKSSPGTPNRFKADIEWL